MQAFGKWGGIRGGGKTVGGFLGADLLHPMTQLSGERELVHLLSADALIESLPPSSPA